VHATLCPVLALRAISAGIGGAVALYPLAAVVTAYVQVPWLPMTKQKRSPQQSWSKRQNAPARSSQHCPLRQIAAPQQSPLCRKCSCGG